MLPSLRCFQSDEFQDCVIYSREYPFLRSRVDLCLPKSVKHPLCVLYSFKPFYAEIWGIAMNYRFQLIDETWFRFWALEAEIDYKEIVDLFSKNWMEICLLKSSMKVNENESSNCTLGTKPVSWKFLDRCIAHLSLAIFMIDLFCPGLWSEETNHKSYQVQIGTSNTSIRVAEQFYSFYQK